MVVTRAQSESLSQDELYNSKITFCRKYHSTNNQSYQPIQQHYEQIWWVTLRVGCIKECQQINEKLSSRGITQKKDGTLDFCKKKYNFLKITL